MALQVKDKQKIDGKIHSWSTKNLLSFPLSLKPKKKLSSQSYRFLKQAHQKSEDVIIISTNNTGENKAKMK